MNAILAGIKCWVGKGDVGLRPSAEVWEVDPLDCRTLRRIRTVVVIPSPGRLLHVRRGPKSSANAVIWRS